MRTFTPGNESLDELFPFHFVASPELILQRCGPLLKLLYPELAAGRTHFTECFRVLQPSIEPEFERFRDSAGSFLSIETLRKQLKFRGQVISLENEGSLLFLCSAWITDLAELKAHELTMSDVASHDSGADLLPRLQAQNTELTDQREKLHAAKRELREAREFRRESEEAARRSAERYRDLFENSNDLIYTFATDGTILSLNRAAERVFGVTREEALGMKLPALVHPDSKEKAEKLWGCLTAGGGISGCEIRFLARSGSAVSLEINSHLVKDGERVLEIQAIARDVTERRAFEALVAGRSQALEMIVTGQPVESTLKCLVALVARQSKGCAASASVLQMGHLVQAVPLDIPIPATGCGDLIALSGAPAGASTEWKPFCSRPIQSSSGQLLGQFDIFSREGDTGAFVDPKILDVAAGLAAVALEQRLLADKLNHLSYHDQLTLLPNRWRFDERLNNGIASARIEKHELALLYIDMDRFKQVNDRLGHTAGDILLTEVAKRLKACISSEDTLARIGGDEFTIIIERNASAEAAVQTAEAVQRALKPAFHVHNRELFAGASIGISMFPDDAEDAAALQTRADVAMYRAKRSGLKHWVRYRKEMDADAPRHFEIEAQLNRALERNELSLDYQPQFTLDPVRLVGMEALLRWNNPVLGRISPAEFIPLAEETGLILPIGKWVLEKACAQAQEWLSAGYDFGRIAVNVSALQFSQKDLPKQISRILSETGLWASRLELELTESTLIRDVNQAVSQMNSIRALGVSISIDDFGTGQSSLSYLRSLPADTLKIDQSFVREQEGDGISPLVTSIIGLGRSLGMTVLAEGVETRRQCEELKDAGCQVVQGFLLGRPIGASQAATLLADESARSLWALSSVAETEVAEQCTSGSGYSRG